MTEPQHKPGDIVNGHRLTQQPDGTLAWFPVETALEPRLGDIVNDHRLTQQADGSLAWLPVVSETKPKPKWYTRKLVIIPAAALILIVIIGSIANGNKPTTAETAALKPTATSSAEQAPSAAPTKEPVKPKVPIKIVVPDVSGLPASQATAVLENAGFTVTRVEDPNAEVTGTTPANGESAEEGSTVTLTVVVKPTLTVAQKNAVGKGKDYLAYQGFSRTGLIGQLEYEGFSTEDATFAADFIAPDWNAEAAEKAKSYMEYQSFSRDGLYDQLEYEGFTPDQIEAGLAAVGY